MKEITPQRAATYLRILYPFWMVAGMLSLIYIPSLVFVEGAPAAVTRHIADNELLFRAGVLGRLLTQLLFIVIPVLLFYLFRPINLPQSLWMLVFALVSVPIAMQNEGHMLSITRALERPERVMELRAMYGDVVPIYHLFWGLWLFPLGRLVMGSGYFPRLMGYLLFAAGFGYTIESVLNILLPELLHKLPYLGLLHFGEVIFILWLVIAGIRLAPQVDPLS